MPPPGAIRGIVEDPSAKRTGWTAIRTTDARLSRTFRPTSTLRLTLLLESFTLFNSLNKRVEADSSGFQINTAQFVPFSQRIGATYYPA